jgi:hypothetical protein
MVLLSFYLFIFIFLFLEWGHGTCERANAASHRLTNALSPTIGSAKVYRVILSAQGRADGTVSGSSHRSSAVSIAVAAPRLCPVMSTPWVG